MHDAIEWAQQRAGGILLAVGNGTAWIQSAIVGDISIGSIVTFCTVALPVIFGGVVLGIQRVGPVWLAYLKDRDAVRTASLSGQMEALTLRLATSNDQRDAEASIAEANAKRADAAAETMRIMAIHLEELRQMLEASKVEAERARTEAEKARTAAEAIKADMDKLRATSHDQVNLLQAEISARKNAEMDLEEIKTGMASQSLQVQKNTASIDATTDKVIQIDGIIKDAASVLAHPDEQPIKAT